MTEKILVLGIVLSILFYECTRLSPGGIIVPGYFALCLTTPLRIGYTLVLVLLPRPFGSGTPWSWSC